MTTFKYTPLFLFSALAVFGISQAQVEVPIENLSLTNTGQAQLLIQSQADKYYVLTSQHSSTFEWEASMTMGVGGSMMITSPGAAYGIGDYTVTEWDIANPNDMDGDGIDDVTEFNNMPTDAPINYAPAVDFVDGTTSIPDAEIFMNLATVNNVGWAPFLDGQLYVKFGILNRDTPNPEVYFINSNTHTIHPAFFNAIGANVTGDDSSGEIVFNPNTLNPNGTLGNYSFNFSFGNSYNFEATQRTYELLIASMPFLQNNMNHFISQNNENTYLNNFANQFEGSTIEVVLESDVFAEINYIPFHEAEGYGYFRHMQTDETPGSRDIVLYDALPNSLPRVGGIITSVVQTPLSHVNLRAIQDDVPNAYIADPLSIDSIASLLGSYVYYKAGNETFEFREATLDEVNAWYEDIRPTEPQIPERDLSITEIMSLDDIDFDMATSFGAKCSNVATMRTFGFSEGTIPYGYGIPFYFFDEFMQYNNFYEEAQVMIDNLAFQTDINFRIDRLDMFRDDIRDAPMPQWMMDALQAMHESFPVGTKVRCRSSTNNEDLPGFSGAGLYTSKTQHLDEGHISKSIKQVYASMWNFRAYEERDFFRVDHFMAAMGVLCHPNFEEEQSNGVGISIDPIYETENTFYINTQVGESLITNPDPNSVPEEILIYEDPDQAGGFLVLNLSNLVEPGQLIMDQSYIDQMRNYLGVIHDEFAVLYDVEGVEGFGMDIEYKVTADDQLAIKQARPWVSFWAGVKGDYDLDFTEFISPVSSSDLGSEIVTATISNTGLNDMSGFELKLLIDDQEVSSIDINETIEPFSSAYFAFPVAQDFSTVGEYNLKGIVIDSEDEYGNNDTLNFVLTKLHTLDAAISIESMSVLCDGTVQANVEVENTGSDALSSLGFYIFSNGDLDGFYTEDLDLAYGESAIVSVEVNGPFVGGDNVFEVELSHINGQVDGELDNNFGTIVSDLESTSDFVTFILNTDEWASETSWDLVDGSGNEIASGDDFSDESEYVYEICLDYNSCYTINVYDSWGDGICCGYGMGNFSVLNSDGQTIVYNDGDFGSGASEDFCPGGAACLIAAEVLVTHSTGEDDGTITINTFNTGSAYVYSINGGQSFGSVNTFTDLIPGEYYVVVEDEDSFCFFEDVVYIEECTLSGASIVASFVSSVVATNGSIVITPTSGVGPYSYSNDGGQTWQDSNEFLGLPVGNYNIVVQDGTGICEYEVNVPVIVDPTGIIEHGEDAKDIVLYPNPTRDMLHIEFNSYNDLHEVITVEIYDNWGRVIRYSQLSNDSNGRTSLSLNGLESGIYYVKCFNNTFETFHKVVKM